MDPALARVAVRGYADVLALALAGCGYNPLEAAHRHSSAVEETLCLGCTSDQGHPGPHCIPVPHPGLRHTHLRHHHIRQGHRHNRLAVVGGVGQAAVFRMTEDLADRIDFDWDDRPLSVANHIQRALLQPEEWWFSKM